VSHFWNVTAKDGNIYLGVHIGQDIKTPISYRRKVKTCLVVNGKCTKIAILFFSLFCFCFGDVIVKILKQLNKRACRFISD